MDRKNTLSHLLFFTFLSLSTTRLVGLNFVKTEFIDPISKINTSAALHEAEIPIRVVVPNTNIDLSIVTSPLKTNVLEVTTEGASYINTESSLNDPISNTILYAHSTNAFFRQLENVAIGDQIRIMSTRRVYFYIITEKFETKPNYVENINSIGDTNLTLFTCAGDNDENRLVVKAKRKELLMNNYEGVI